MIKRLIIVDVSNFICRAFYAIKPLHSPDGIPTNAVYGFYSMMLNLIRDYQPTHMFLAKDTKGGGFRKELYSDYKANRSEGSSDLTPQFLLIDELIDRMGLASFGKLGFEADDIIGSACTQWKDSFDHIYIATGDKDMMQFVGDNIKVLDTMKNKLYDSEGVIEKMGVRPDQIVDFLSITGDSSDNIPGLPGIGPAGAIKLLKQYDTLDNIITNKDLLTGKKTIEAFNDHLEKGLMSRQLVQIVTDIEIPYKPEDTKYTFTLTDNLNDYLLQLGFKSFSR